MCICAVQGCATQMGWVLFFFMGKLRHGPAFLREKTLHMGPFFQKVKKFCVFAIKIFLNFQVFARRKEYGFRGLAGTPPSKPNLSNPLPGLK